MKFCTQCESVMTKNTSAAGTIVFQCRCQLTVNGEPDDTLMAEGFLESTTSNLKHGIFVENAPFDPAANTVMRDCLNCGLDFVTMIRVGVNETTVYGCTCGWSMNHTDYMKARAGTITAKPKKSKETQSASG